MNVYQLRKSHDTEWRTMLKKMGKDEKGEFRSVKLSCARLYDPTLSTDDTIRQLVEAWVFNDVESTGNFKNRKKKHTNICIWSWGPRKLTVKLSM
jgi:hypothetical protein